MTRGCCQQTGVGLSKPTPRLGKRCSGRAQLGLSRLGQGRLVGSLLLELVDCTAEICLTCPRRCGCLSQSLLRRRDCRFQVGLGGCQRVHLHCQRCGLCFQPSSRLAVAGPKVGHCRHVGIVDALKLRERLRCGVELRLKLSMRRDLAGKLLAERSARGLLGCTLSINRCFGSFKGSQLVGKGFNIARHAGYLLVSARNSTVVIGLQLAVLLGEPRQARSSGIKPALKLDKAVCLRTELLAQHSAGGLVGCKLIVHRSLGRPELLKLAAEVGDLGSQVGATLLRGGHRRCMLGLQLAVLLLQGAQRRCCGAVSALKLDERISFAAQLLGQDLAGCLLIGKLLLKARNRGLQLLRRGTSRLRHPLQCLLHTGLLCLPLGQQRCVLRCPLRVKRAVLGLPFGLQRCSRFLPADLQIAMLRLPFGAQRTVLCFPLELQRVVPVLPVGIQGGVLGLPLGLKRVVLGGQVRLGLHGLLVGRHRRGLELGDGCTELLV